MAEKKAFPELRTYIEGGSGVSLGPVLLRHVVQHIDDQAAEIERLRDALLFESLALAIARNPAAEFDRIGYEHAAWFKPVHESEVVAIGSPPQALDARYTLRLPTAVKAKARRIGAAAVIAAIEAEEEGGSARPKPPSTPSPKCGAGYRAPQYPATRDAGEAVTVCQRACRCGPDGCADSVACPRR